MIHLNFLAAIRIAFLNVKLSDLCFGLAALFFIGSFLGWHTSIPTPGGSLTQIGLALLALGLAL